MVTPCALNALRIGRTPSKWDIAENQCPPHLNRWRYSKILFISLQRTESNNAYKKFHKSAENLVIGRAAVPTGSSGAERYWRYWLSTTAAELGKMSHSVRMIRSTVIHGLPCHFGSASWYRSYRENEFTVFKLDFFGRGSAPSIKHFMYPTCFSLTRRFSFCYCLNNKIEVGHTLWGICRSGGMWTFTPIGCEENVMISHLEISAQTKGGEPGRNNLRHMKNAWEGRGWQWSYMNFNASKTYSSSDIWVEFRLLDFNPCVSSKLNFYSPKSRCSICWLQLKLFVV